MIGLLSKYKGFIGIIVAPNGIHEREETLLGECTKSLDGTIISSSYPIIILPRIDHTLDQHLSEVKIPQEVLQIDQEEFNNEIIGPYEITFGNEIVIKSLGNNTQPQRQIKSTYQYKRSRTIYKKY